MDHKNEGPARGKTAAEPIEDSFSSQPLFNGKNISLKAEPQSEAYQINPVYRQVSSVDVAPIEWTWHRTIASGKLSLIAGQPGLGKSQITCRIAADITTGGEFPGGSKAPNGSVLFVSCEDDVSDTIGPRLMAAGADLTRVYVLDAVSESEGGISRERSFDLTDVSVLQKLATELGDLQAIIVDPVSAYMAGADSHKTSDVRALLAPLAQLAAQQKLAIILVTHLNKGSSDGSAMSRVTGSGAFVAAARAAFLVEKDPDDEEGKRRIFAPLKNNIGDDVTAYAYHIEGVTLGNGIETSRAVWEGPVAVKASDLVSTSNDTREERSAVTEACEVLRELLKDGKPRTATSIKKEASEAGISEASLRRAKQSLGVKSRKSANTGSWTWELTPRLVSGSLSNERVAHLEHVQQNQPLNFGEVAQGDQGVQGAQHSRGWQ